MKFATALAFNDPTHFLELARTADEVFRFLVAHQRATNTALLIVTHDPRLARRCDRIVALVDGRVTYDGPAAGFDG